VFCGEAAVIPVEYRLVPFIAVVGSGPIGGALAHKLAQRDRTREIRLIDPHAGIAQGKALDILQASPVDRFSSRVVAAQALSSAAGAEVIVLADAGETGAEHAGEAGLSMLRQIAAIDTSAPLVFAGASQRDLIGRAVGELRMPRTRVMGAAPGALESAIRALVGLAIDVSGVEVQLRVVGTPPNALVVGWEEATASGMPLRDQVPPHTISALNARVPTLWPPGPFALASAAARVVEGLLHGSRRRFTCLVSLDSGPSRQSVAAMPIELGPRGILRVIEPTLTEQERTRMQTAIERF
jgi:malate dehydrogenase